MHFFTTYEFPNMENDYLFVRSIYTNYISNYS